MVGTRRKRQSPSVKTENTKPPPKKKSIDMSRIPESLKREGFIELNGTEDVPEYLKCPTCKEILVDPEMYLCGHTLCKICIESSVKLICPLCKNESSSTRLIPNFILREMIDAQYPTQKEKRKIQLEEMRGLKDKLMTYPRSTRFRTLSQNLNEILEKKVHCHYQILFNELKNVQDPVFEKHPVSEEEMKFFLACILKKERGQIGVIGEHLLNRNIGPVNYVNWVHETSTKKKFSESKRWVPLILMSLSCTNFCFSTYRRVSKIYKLDIGDELPLEEWKGKPAHWLKDLELELLDFLTVGFTSSDEEDSDAEDSSFFSDSNF